LAGTPACAPGLASDTFAADADSISALATAIAE
jgi:hypothetical protein